MRLQGRLAAAAEVLEQVLSRHSPASTALGDWGKANRFAGSGDRAAIGTLVYDVLRRKSSLAAQMQSEAPRALVIAAAGRAFGLSFDEVCAAADGSRHALLPLSDQEREALARGVPADAPEHVRADVPEWLVSSLTRTFGDRLVAEGQAMAERAPIDLRVNTLKATRDEVLEVLAPFGAKPTRFSPVGVRIPAPIGAAKSPHVEAEAAHGRGWFEVQDEGSQIAACLSGVKSGETVLDLCAGAGGKTLALASLMANDGKISAYDRDKLQLRPIFERMARAGGSIIDVLSGGDRAQLMALSGTFDSVLVDAPCSGSGTWRRRPDSKWRLKPQALKSRIADQESVLSDAARLVRPGGRITYVTCSVLPEENGDQITRFLASHPGFRARPIRDVWRETLGGEAPASADGGEETLLLSPGRHGTDGFFIASLEAPP